MRLHGRERLNLYPQADGNAERTVGWRRDTPFCRAKADIIGASLSAMSHGINPRTYRWGHTMESNPEAGHRQEQETPGVHRALPHNLSTPRSFGSGGILLQTHQSRAGYWGSKDISRPPRVIGLSPNCGDNFTRPIYYGPCESHIGVGFRQRSDSILSGGC